MWLNYRNPHCHLLFNFQPYRLQSEQVKHKANSPPESRRPNSKASKATASSATGQSRGHSSRRYPFSLLGVYCVCVCLWVCTLSSTVTLSKIHNKEEHTTHCTPLGFVVNLNDYNECDIVIHLFPWFEECSDMVFFCFCF